MKRMWILGLLATALIAFCVIYTMRANGGDVKPAAKIMQSDVDVDVLAHAMDLQIYAFDLPIPDQECTLSVWMEHWTRNASEPQIFGLFTIMSLVGEGSGKLTICLPTTNHPQGLVNWSTHGGKTVSMGPNATSTPIKSSVSSGINHSLMLDMKEITGTAFIEPRAMVMGQDMPLMALQYNKSGISHSTTEHIENNNDVTWYLRARFTPGKANHGIVAWKDGKIDIQ